MAIKSRSEYKQNLLERATKIPGHWEETIWDDERPYSERVTAIARTREEAREKAERKFRDGRLEK